MAQCQPLWRLSNRGGRRRSLPAAEDGYATFWYRRVVFVSWRGFRIVAWFSYLGVAVPGGVRCEAA